jgi:predicted ATPase with chaperone activity
LDALAYHKVLKLERTIADLIVSEAISNANLVEVRQYRPELDLM